MIGAGPAVAIGGLATVLSAMAISAVLPAISQYRFSDPTEPLAVAGPEPTIESAGS
jgi:hypothetical protein